MMKFPRQQTLLILFLGVFSSTAYVHGQDRAPTRIGKTEPLTKEQAVVRLDQFRNQRLSKDFTFQFELEHIPRRGDSTIYNGYMWGTWNSNGPLIRARYSTIPDAYHGRSIELILQNGRQPSAWFRNLENVEPKAPRLQPEFIQLPPTHWYRPILPGVDYTPFDLLMPFTYWERTEYMKPDKVKGRPAQVYEAYPPQNFPGANVKFSSIRYALDDSYNALLRVETLDTSRKPIQTFQILSFKKIEEGEWIVKTIDLINEVTRDKARFEVRAAKLHDSLPPILFDPANKSLPQPQNLNQF
jgi:hypothetical protein